MGRANEGRTGVRALRRELMGVHSCPDCDLYSSQVMEMINGAGADRGLR